MILCYLTAPGLIVLVRNLEKKILLLSIILCNGALVFASIIQLHYEEVNSIYDNPFFRILEFFMGVLIACFWKQHSYRHSRDKQGRFTLYATGVFALSTALLIWIVSKMYDANILRGNYMAYSIVGIPYFILTISVLQYIKFSTRYGEKIAKSVGALSYSFYLSNLLYGKYVMEFCQVHPTITNMQKIGMILGVNIILALTLHFAVEKPCGKLIISKWTSTSSK